MSGIARPVMNAAELGRNVIWPNRTLGVGLFVAAALVAGCGGGNLDAAKVA